MADVLDPLIPSTTPFVMMNQALRIAAGLNVAPDWESAAALVASLDDIADHPGLVARPGAQSTDTEGHWCSPGFCGTICKMILTDWG